MFFGLASSVSSSPWQTEAGDGLQVDWADLSSAFLKLETCPAGLFSEWSAQCCDSSWRTSVIGIAGKGRWGQRWGGRNTRVLFCNSLSGPLPWVWMSTAAVNLTGFALCAFKNIGKSLRLLLPVSWCVCSGKSFYKKLILGTHKTLICVVPKGMSLKTITVLEPNALVEAVCSVLQRESLWVQLCLQEGWCSAMVLGAGRLSNEHKKIYLFLLSFFLV